MQILLQPLTAGTLFPVGYFIFHPDISAVVDVVNDRCNLISADLAKLGGGSGGFGARCVLLNLAFFPTQGTYLPVSGLVVEILITKLVRGVSYIPTHGTFGAALLLVGVLLKILFFIALIAGVPVSGAV